MQMVQVHFEHLMPSGMSNRVAWVDVAWKLKVGDLVQFDDDDGRLWTVKEVYQSIIDAAELNKKWGLELPKSQRTER